MFVPDNLFYDAYTRCNHLVLSYVIFGMNVAVPAVFLFYVNAHIIDIVDAAVASTGLRPGLTAAARRAD